MSNKTQLQTNNVALDGYIAALMPQKKLLPPYLKLVVAEILRLAVLLYQM
jgi:hypothetical protein